MFLVFNKDNILSFIVAACTVCVLFMMTSLFAKVVPGNTVETASTNKEVPIYNVETRRGKNCINNELCLE